MSSNTAVEEREDVDDTPSPRSPKTTALIVKVILVGLVDALLIISFAKAASDDWWLAAVFFAVVFLAVNFAYFTNKALPLKYLLPGLVFLVAFQIYTMVFTGYASFTNYGSNHLGAKDESIASIQAKNVVPVDAAGEVRFHFPNLLFTRCFQFFPSRTGAGFFGERHSIADVTMRIA